MHRDNSPVWTLHQQEQAGALKLVIADVIVEKRKQSAIANGSIGEEEFEGKRFVERIMLLKDYLPDVLVKNKDIYTVLSKGIHDLEEQECLEYFPLIKELMFLILQENLEEQERNDRKDNIAAELAKIAGSMKSTGETK